LPSQQINRPPVDKRWGQKPINRLPVGERWGQKAD